MILMDTFISVGYHNVVRYIYISLFMSIYLREIELFPYLLFASFSYGACMRRPDHHSLWMVCGSSIVMEVWQDSHGGHRPKEKRICEGLGADGRRGLESSFCIGGRGTTQQHIHYLRVRQCWCPLWYSCWWIVVLAMSLGSFFRTLFASLFNNDFDRHICQIIFSDLTMAVVLTLAAKMVLWGVRRERYGKVSRD